MKIVGFQKLSLLDFPGKIACIIWTAGCNLNCSYCQNSGILQEYQTNFEESEILDYLKKRKNMLEGICISGGEPLLQNDLVDFCKKVKEIGLEIKLDTNGTLPDKLQTLIDEKLVDYVAMDIKSGLSEYSKVCGKSYDYGKILKSLEILKQDKVEYELRTTFIKPYHNIENLSNIGSLIKDAKVYYIQNFHQSEGVRDHSLSGFEENELQTILQKAKLFNQNSYLR